MTTIALLLVIVSLHDVLSIPDSACNNAYSKSVKPDIYEPCGCFYNVFAKMPQSARERSACSRNCVYRTVAGRCNNRCNPTWGEAQGPYGRLLKPDFCESIAPDAPRCAYDGSPLPSSRSVSVALFQDKPPREMDKFVTSTHMVFGQFLSHDLARTNEPKLTDDNDRDLCGSTECNKNDVCFPIEILVGDPAFSPQRCLKFHRSTRRETHLHECRDQQNDISSYIDLNTVYGSTLGEMDILRDARPRYKAYLNMTSMSVLRLGPNVKTGKDLLPQTDGVKCRGKTDQIKCFMAGDRRVGEQVQLSVLHVLFAREHNRLVAKLDEINEGCWSQDRLFEEARKINIAQFQVIVYNEYLNVMFSHGTMKKFGLYLNKGEYSYEYDKKLNATVSNVFQTAAFRFGHTQIPNILALARNQGKNFQIYKNVSFSAVFHNPTLLYNSMAPDVTGTDAIALGMVALSAEAADLFFNKQITQSFDAETVDGLGRDLEALDIERGRDHGLPGYNQWRKFCRLPYAVSSFDQFVDIPAHLRVLLSLIYKSVEDVDLYAGAMAESLEAGALVGPTFSCLNAEQFMRVKFGDRFWHENPLAGLTRPQLKSVSRMTFGKILCNNLDDAQYMPPNIFIHPKSKAEALFADVTSEWPIDFVYDDKLGHNNEPVHCSDLPGTDLSLWHEEGCWNEPCDSH